MSNITKRALEDSLKHLLLKKPVNKITINDIFLLSFSGYLRPDRMVL